MTTLTPADQALLALLRHLENQDYRFVTPTPATHARVLARPDRREARDLAGALGWSLPFARGLLGEAEALLDAAGMLEPAQGDRLRSRVRVSSLGDLLFLHSAYPTLAEDAVFFGPDSYRFADLIAAELPRCPEGTRIVDIGAGAGVGALVAAGLCPHARVTMTDINPQALRLARINAAAAGIEPELIETSGLEKVEGAIDLALANPPYIADGGARAYRDGGDMHGGRLSLDMAAEAVGRLSAGGKMILYTGSAIVDGRDALREALAGLAAERGCTLRYREIDPDVFGEELEQEAYRDVDRIALVAAVLEKL